MARRGSGNCSQTVLLAFVLDKSGSMGSICDATISGFNEYRDDQARQPGEAVMSLTMFDTTFEKVCRPSPIDRVPSLTRENYRPGGCTALYDAIAHAVRDVDRYVEDAARRPDKVLVVIMTDGQENSSREFSRERVFEMITDRQENHGYEFVYLGADQDSYAVGQSIGLRPGRVMNWIADERGGREVFERMSRATCDLRQSGQRVMKEDWLDADELIEGRRREGGGGRAPRRAQ